MEKETQEKAQEAPQEVVQEVAQEAPKKPKEKKSKSVDAEAKPVDKSTYDKFTSLKFIELSGVKLTDEAKKELKELETELKGCTGTAPIRTQRAAIMNEQVLIVEGIPLPYCYLEIIKASKNPAYYIG